MTEEERKQIDAFETKLRHLVYLHSESTAEIDRLTHQLAEKDEALNDLKDRLHTLEQDYTRLKTAATIGRATGLDASETRKRLAGLVREIDKCISLVTH